MSATTWPLNVPVITDGLVTLRAHTPADIDRALQMAHDHAMVRWTGVPTPHSRAMSEQFALEVVPKNWNQGTAMCWAIEFEGRYAGNVDIRGKDPLADIGFALHPDCRGQGVMTAAVRLAVDHAFVEAGKEAIQWTAHVGNVGSLRVAHACGFRLHGTEPDRLFERGRILDAWTGSIRFGDVPAPRTTWLESTLATERLRLRPLVESDVPRITEACAHPSTRLYLSHMPDPYTVEDTRRFLYAAWWNAAIDKRQTWAITEPGDGRLLGTISVMDLDGPAEHNGELGYWMHPDARGRGLMTEAARAVVEHAFDPEELDLDRLSIVAGEGNTASLRIAESLGFSHYGTEHRTARLADGTVTDHHLYERLR
ncbi:GNAT family N-acetyltransferase [Aeromicrobium choanae]|uniref:Protein N-acetyltransferase, RimJ/RimL family n=1 Tax=Aeromicrobium choanae TaxID=1736691 RepID=A0A1T4Z2Q6_9ACTN|nr:GNAT family N-acetyltransferase [Aeromicrobium choanae]SKB08236.1 Protein N-acetyltransferase, RimJ/RimL family [Aeromicrobium choanae]